MLTRYHFTTLWYQESLGSSEAMPFAVIAESERFVYCIGYHLVGDATITGQIRKNFPEILRERIAHTSKIVRATNGLALDELCKEFVWNIRAEGHQRSWPSFSSIEKFAERTFQRRVANWKSAHARVESEPVLTFETMKFGFGVPAIATA